MRGLPLHLPTTLSGGMHLLPQTLGGRPIMHNEQQADCLTIPRSCCAGSLRWTASRQPTLDRTLLMGRTTIRSSSWCVLFT